MDKLLLGRLKKIDVRKYWGSESRDFTPWLAEKDNIDLLGETIGIDLEVEAQEKKVGPFSADILCKDTISENWVLIENQLEQTDHKHLGQLLTYSAGLNAVTIVWIADRFTDEHAATLDWLNKITDGRFNFFGLEIELWQIGDSLLAPKFNVVSKPNDWTQTINKAANQLQTENLSEIKQLQQAYWTAFNEYLSKQSTLRPQKPLPQHWTNFAIGRSNFHTTASLNTAEKKVGVALILTGADAKPHFHLLYQMKDSIETEMGTALEWRMNPNNKESSIRLRADLDPTNKNQWDTQHAWLKKHLELFRSVFSSRIKKLDASEYNQEGNDC